MLRIDQAPARAGARDACLARCTALRWGPDRRARAEAGRASSVHAHRHRPYNGDLSGAARRAESLSLSLSLVEVCDHARHNATNHNAAQYPGPVVRPATERLRTPQQGRYQTNNRSTKHDVVGKSV